MTPESRLETFTALLGWHHKTDEVATKAQSMGRSLALEKCLSQPTSNITVPNLLSTEKVKTDECANDPIKNMEKQVCIERRAIDSLPGILLGNTTLSFGELVDSRLQQFARLLSTRKKPETSKQAAKLLQGSAPITFTHAESIFRTLPLSKAFVKHQASRRIVIIPFIFTVKIYTEVLGVKTVQVRLTAPGTIVGTFFTDDSKISHAEILIDVDRLHKSMKMRCDQVIKKAYDTATSLTENSEAQKTTAKTLPTPESNDNVKHRWWLREDEPTFKPPIQR